MSDIFCELMGCQCPGLLSDIKVKTVECKMGIKLVRLRAFIAERSPEVKQRWQDETYCVGSNARACEFVYLKSLSHEGAYIEGHRKLSFSYTGSDGDVVLFGFDRIKGALVVCLCRHIEEEVLGYALSDVYEFLMCYKKRDVAEVLISRSEELLQELGSSTWSDVSGLLSFLRPYIEIKDHRPKVISS